MKTQPEERTGWVARTASDVEPHLSRLRFARSRSDVMLSGVAGGLGTRWGVDPMLVRIAFVLLSYAGAFGVLVYLAAWAVSLDPDDRRAPAGRPSTVEQAVAFGAIGLGSLLLLRSVGLWFGDRVGVPLMIVGVGAALIYVGTGQGGAPTWARFSFGSPLATGRPSVVRLAVGGLFVMGGAAWFLAINRSFEGIFAVVLAVVVTGIGLTIVFGPWIHRMGNQLTEERRDRIRSEERAELAAHLHDSVLQTLALIQRNAGDARRMASLARRQERELRSWLYGHPPTHAPDRLQGAIEAMAADVEEAHEVAVEVVTVGDCPLDERTQAVVHACREAATNAARHSGAEEVSVYVECEAEGIHSDGPPGGRIRSDGLPGGRIRSDGPPGGRIHAFVRDRGRGFDPNGVPSDRRGIADSIRGRIERHGGTVTITSAPGEGCEVHIELSEAT